jgi:p-hydroxybenzoate 3-monooxygenase
VCRPSIGHALTSFECLHPFGWLGVLAEAPPIALEVTYSCHERGLALFSMRTPQVSRLYLQCAPDEDLEQWSAERIWDELRLRLDVRARELRDGAILEKVLVRMRSFVTEPMQHGRLFLVGDAAHIVPPSAAKGLNLAVGDVCLLARALERFYATDNEQPLRDYSRTALPRIWEGQRFSQWMTRLLHRFRGDGAFDRRIQLAELDRIMGSGRAAVTFAEAYVGRSYVDEAKDRHL